MQDLTVEPWLLVDDSLRFDDPRLADLLAYWQNRVSDGRLPARPEFDPLELRALIGQMYVIDVVGAPAHYRYRLIGTGIVEPAGADATGKTVREVFGAGYSDAVVRAFDHVVKSRRPLRFSGRMQWHDREFMAYESLLLPLASDRRTVDVLFGAMLIQPAPQEH